ncbi:hypothetical protein GCM10027586_13420 [Kineococcus gypseus]|uniref:hypothetical protein n=1 Tax=Kineococcus gypseus TaxID=1637102 RepID=UPI003D7EAA5C
MTSEDRDPLIGALDELLEQSVLLHLRNGAQLLGVLSAVRDTSCEVKGDEGTTTVRLAAVDAVTAVPSRSAPGLFATAQAPRGS